jgi:hypothetical protein
MTKLIIGKEYKCTNPNPFPMEMIGARKTLKMFGSDLESVAYDFVRTDGVTGQGSMTMEHAEKHLKKI